MQELRQHLDIQHQNLSENFIRKALVKKEKCQPIKINVLDYSCKLCNDEISNFEDLKNHLIGKHQKPIDLNNDGVLPYKITENEYICVLCESKFEQFELLNRHINKHYTKFICDQCGAGFASEARLRRHVESHKVGAYPCEECGKVFGKITTKQVHIQTVHLNAKKNKCMYCEELFKNYYQKQQHLLDAHGIKMRIFKCSLCPKIFSRSGSLRCHERYNHIKAQVFACELCEYQSHDKGTLRRHMICHSDEKKYKCEVCEKSYARLGTWKEHMKIHYNIRRFACQYCGRAFVQKCSLKGHLKTHHLDQMKEDNLQLDQV